MPVVQETVLRPSNAVNDFSSKAPSDSVLRIAVQKKGRLSDQSITLLRNCGVRVFTGGALCAPASNFPLELLLLRDDDIPRYVSEGVADVGIVGENVLQESAAQSVRTIEKLGFGRCRLSLAVPRESTYTGLDWFEGKQIATSYPRILNSYLQQNGVSAQIDKLSGSVEIAPAIGLASGICDIVSTGSTLKANGLWEVEEVMRSEAVLIAGKQLEQSQEAILDQLLFRIQAVQRAATSKYILLNAPDDKLEEIASILPGIKSPTVLPLLREGWSSLHSVVKEDKFWEIIDELRAAGAEGILVSGIEKMIV